MTSRYTIPASVPGIVDMSRGVRGLNMEAFQAAPWKRPVVGAFGELASGADPVTSFDLPPEYQLEALLKADPGFLENLIQQASQRYDAVEQDWTSETPPGYTGIYATEDGPLEGPDPGQMPGNQMREQALSFIRQLGDNAKAALTQQQQAQLKAQNSLYGDIAEAGYEFAPGALNDAGIRGTLNDLLASGMQAPQIVKQPGISNFLYNSKAPMGRKPWEASFTADELRRMGIPLGEHLGASNQPGAQQVNLIQPGATPGSVSVSTQNQGQPVQTRYPAQATVAPQPVAPMERNTEYPADARENVPARVRMGSGGAQYPGAKPRTMYRAQRGVV